MKRKADPAVRVYPACCTSAYCGNSSDSCPTCPNGPALQEFKDWKTRTAAQQTDPIWTPTVYRATHSEGVS